MNKVEEIFKSWAIALDPNRDQAELAQERIQVCDTCENKKTDPYLHCGLCGCPLQGKIYTPVTKGCPDGRWER